MPASDPELLRDFLKCAEIPDTETNMNQLSVLMQAFEKFVERNAKYVDLWKAHGIEDTAHHVRSKAARVGMVLRPEFQMPASAVLDDGIDLINYSVFFVRHVRES